MSMSGFICHDDYLQKTSKLSDEEVGRLFRSLMKYHSTGVIDDLDGRESIAFDFIREDIDRTEDAYKTKCERNKANRNGALAKIPEEKRSSTIDDERQRSSTVVNDRPRSSTIVNDRPQKEKEKEIYKDKYKEKEKEKETDAKRARADELEKSFDSFWACYPRKEAKVTAKAAFSKIDPDSETLRTMLASLEAWKKSDQWTRDGGQFIPHPSTWLNQRRWEDEPPKPGTSRPGQVKHVIEQDYTQRENDESDGTGIPDWLSRALDTV